VWSPIAALADQWRRAFDRHGQRFIEGRSIRLARVGSDREIAGAVKKRIEPA